MTGNTRSVTVKEKRPRVGTRCADPRCGVAVTAGHPRDGWVRVFVAGSGKPARWYSSYECLAYDLVLRPALAREPKVWARDPRRGFTVDEALRLMNRYSGYPMTTLGLTRVRVGYAYMEAVAALDVEHPLYDEVVVALAAARGVLLDECEPIPAAIHPADVVEDDDRVDDFG